MQGRRSATSELKHIIVFHIFWQVPLEAISAENQDICPR